MPKKNKILSIFSFLLIFLFLLPSVANAFIGTGIFDYFTSSLEGVEEFSDFATKLFQQISFLLLITYISLAVSASLLQWAISIPIGLYNNTLVWSGWNFTLGLANTFFILIFIIIALAYILKIETIGQKKILVNLILVALLVNFSLLLVGAVADIATFFQNTILGGETDLVGLVMKNLMGGVEGMLVTLGSWLVAFVVLYAIPFSGPFAQLSLTLRTIVTAGMLGVFGPTLMGWVLIIILGLGVAGIFYLYFFFFVIRAYIIWALAVLAPLAFICLILPQTKKWWDEWLKHLLEWTFLGILLLLWLVLGLKLMGSLMPGGGTTITPIIGWAQIGEHAKYFLFLFVYLVIGLFIMSKTMPALAATVTALAGQIGGAVWGGVIKPGIGSLRRPLWGPAAGGLAGAEKWEEKAEERAKRFEEAGKKGRAAFMRRLAPAAGVVGRRVIAPFARPWKPELIEYAAKQRRVTLPGGWKQMSIPEKEMYIDSLPRKSDKLVLASEMKEEKTYQKASRSFREKMRKIGKDSATDLRYAKEVGDLMDAEPDKITREMLINFKIAPIVSLVEKEDERKKINTEIENIMEEYKLTDENQAAGIYYARRIKPADVAGMTKDSVKSVAFQLAMRGGSSEHLKILKRSFDEETIRAALEGERGLNKITTKEELMKIYSENSRLVRWAYGNPAGREMLKWSTTPKLKNFLKDHPEPPPKPSPEKGRQTKLEEFEEKAPPEPPKGRGEMGGPKEGRGEMGGPKGRRGI